MFFLCRKLNLAAVVTVVKSMEKSAIERNFHARLVPDEFADVIPEEWTCRLAVFPRLHGVEIYCFPVAKVHIIGDKNVYFHGEKRRRTVKFADGISVRILCSFDMDDYVEVDAPFSAGDFSVLHALNRDGVARADEKVLEILRKYKIRHYEQTVEPFAGGRSI